MRTTRAWVIALVVGVVFGWLAAGAVTLLSDDTSSTGGGSNGGGPVAAEWLVGLGAGLLATVVVGLGLQRAA